MGNNYSQKQATKKELNVGDHVVTKNGITSIHGIYVDDSKKTVIYYDKTTMSVTGTYLTTFCGINDRLYKCYYNAEINIMPPFQTIWNAKRFLSLQNYQPCCLSGSEQFAYKCKINRYTVNALLQSRNSIELKTFKSDNDNEGGSNTTSTDHKQEITNEIKTLKNTIKLLKHEIETLKSNKSNDQSDDNELNGLQIIQDFTEVTPIKLNLPKHDNNNNKNILGSSISSTPVHVSMDISQPSSDHDPSIHDKLKSLDKHLTINKQQQQQKENVNQNACETDTDDMEISDDNIKIVY